MPLKPGEKIVSSANYRDKLLVFTNYGTVFEIKFDEHAGLYIVQIVLN